MLVQGDTDVLVKALSDMQKMYESIYFEDFD